MKMNQEIEGLFNVTLHCGQSKDTKQIKKKKTIMLNMRDGNKAKV